MDEPLLLKETEERSLYTQYISHNWETPKKQRLFFIRIVGMVIILLTILVFPLINNQPLKSSDCMVDQLFLLTDQINIYFYENRDVKNLIVIVAAFFLDIALLIYLVDYML